jgi:hypothetical protein
MAVQGKSLVLRKDVDPTKVRVHAVGEGDVDDAILAAEGYGWLGAVASQGIESFTGATG